MENITFQLQQQLVNVLDKLEDLMFMILFLAVVSNIIDACTAKVAVPKICVNMLGIDASVPSTVAIGSVWEVL